jgi:hypothetical protein
VPDKASEDFLRLVETVYQALRAYQFGHEGSQLAKLVADEIAKCLTRVKRRPGDWENDDDYGLPK